MGARMRRLAPLPLADADGKERMRLCAATRRACVCVWSLGSGMRKGAWASDQRANDQGGMLLLFASSSPPPSCSSNKKPPTASSTPI